MKTASILTKGLAILFAAAFVVVLPLTLFVFNAEQHLMRPERYKTALAERGLYEEIPVLLAAELNKLSTQAQPDQAESRQREAFAKVMQSLDEEDWLFMVESLMPEGWVQSQVEASVDSIFAYLDGETETLNIAVSLEALKSQLRSPQGEKVLLRLVEALPPCTASDLFTFAFDFFSGDDPELPICAPPLNLIEDNISSLNFLLAMSAEALPDSISLRLTEEDLSTGGPESQTAKTNLVTTYRATKRVREIIPFVGGGLLVLIAIFAVRSLHGLFNWWGWPLTLGSAAALVPAFATRNLLIVLMENFILARLPERTPAGFKEILINILREFSRTMLSSTTKDAALLLLAGLGMVATGFILNRRRQEKSLEQDFSKN